jgi:DNA-binding IclR family transcriptional regulator
MRAAPDAAVVVEGEIEMTLPEDGRGTGDCVTAMMMKGKAKPTREEDRHVEAVLRMIDLVECFRKGRPELSLTELGDMTGLQKSRVLRLCGTLVHKGYLIRDEDTLRYSLGSKFMVLGRIYEHTNSLATVGRTIIRELAGQTSETSSLFIIQGIRRLCLVREDGDQPVRLANVQGDILDLHRGVGGKVLLAFAEDDERERLMQAFADDPSIALSRAEAKRLREDFEVIRRDGYTLAFEDVIPGVGSLAAPVFDYAGRCCASIAVAGPVQRVSPDRTSVLLRSLLAAAAELSSRLGHAPDAVAPRAGGLRRPRR